MQARWLWIIMTAGFSMRGPAASADDWGCQVLLCLSDPRGPTTESACEAPISRLRRHLAKGRAFPACALAGDAERQQGTYGREVMDAYDHCPAGTRPVSGAVATASAAGTAWRELPYQHSGAGDPDRARTLKQAAGPQQRACAGTLLGTFAADANRQKTGPRRITVQVYDRVIWQKPHPSARAMDIFIDGAWHHRARF